jgi:hypothetical protein
VVCLAPRAPGDSVRPRRQSGVIVRPLNFPVRRLRKVTAMLGAYYPMFIAIGGLFGSALLSERALALMPPEAKATLVDSFARTRLLNLLVVALFVALMLWRPLVGWVFLGCSFLALGARSMLRLRRLGLPATPSRLLLAAWIMAVGGLVTCALIYALRASR